MVKQARPRGLTLAELLLAGTLTGLLMMMLPRLITNIHGLTARLTVQIEIQREMRDVLGLITKDLRQAVASSVVIDSLAGQPPYSRITFTKGGTNFRYWQEGTALMFVRPTVGENPKRFSNLLVSMYFVYPNTGDTRFISVYICMEKTVSKTTVKRYETIVEKVEIMN